MPKIVKDIVYEKADYDALKDMSVDDVIAELESVDRGYLGSSRYYGQEDYEGDEWDYDLYKKHLALRKAILILREMSSNRGD